MSVTIEQVQAIAIPKNISKLNNSQYLGVAIPNQSVNLYEAIEVVYDELSGLPNPSETDLTATQNLATTTLHSSTGDDVVILGADATRSGVMTASQATNLAALITLSGVSAAATNLGTFTGTTITDSATIKSAFQELETALEAVANESSQDAVGGILINTSTIDLTYLDGVPSISADVNDNAITFAKMQTIGTQKLLGRSTAGTGNVEQITIGSGLNLTGGTLTATGGSGTVTSVAITTPGFLSVSGSPITTSGTLALSLATQTANTVFVGPTTGTSAPTFRLLVAADIPSLTSSKISDFSEAVDDRVNALLVAGTGITLTYDDGADTLTIDASGLGYTDEEAQDAIGTILLDSTTIDFAYDDVTPNITAGVKSNSLTNTLLTSGTGGIYKGSGTIASGVVSTLTASSTFRVNYSNANPAYLGDDLNNTSTIFSGDGTQYVSVDNTSVLIGSNSVELEWIDGLLKVPTTITAPATTGNQTIDKMSGTVNFAAAATSLTVTNSLVTANSIVLAVIRTDDSTAILKNVVPSAGSFVINMDAAPSDETSVGFIVINN